MRIFSIMNTFVAHWKDYGYDKEIRAKIEFNNALSERTLKEQMDLLFSTTKLDAIIAEIANKIGAVRV